MVALLNVMVGIECECGNSKRPRAQACSRCLKLDGYAGRGKASAWEIIQTIRASGGRIRRASLYRELCIGDDAFTVLLSRLVKKGRVRVLRDADDGDLVVLVGG